MNFKDPFTILLDNLILDDKSAYLGGQITSIDVVRETMTVMVDVSFPKVFEPKYEKALREEVINFFVNLQGYKDCKFKISFEDNKLTNEMLVKYYEYILSALSEKKHRYGCLNTFDKILEDEVVKVFCASEENKEIIAPLLKDVEKSFERLGLNVKCVISVSPFVASLEQKTEETKKKSDEEIFKYQNYFDSLKEGVANSDSSQTKIKRRPSAKSAINGKPVPISSLPRTEVEIYEYQQQYGSVEFVVQGRVENFEIVERMSKDKSKKFKIFSCTLVENNACVVAKTFVNNNNGLDHEKFYRENCNDGSYVKAYGWMNYDKFARDVVLNIKEIIALVGDELIEQEKQVEKSKYDRIELHAHTKMSTLDGVMDVKDYVKRVSDYGYSACAVTDHYNIQVLPTFYKECKSHNIKPIFGVEAGMVDSKNFKVAFTDEDIDLANATYVVYDLETTGLSSNYDEIIEVAACKVKNGMVIDEFSEYVKPNREIDDFTTELTSITNDDVRNALSIDDVLPRFVEFFKGSILVAHNASFDNSHIKANMKRLGIYHGEEFPTIDTMQVARVFYGTKLKRFNLDAVCKLFDVENVHHHRAIYDARATAAVFIKMLYNMLDKGIKNYNEINNYIDYDNVYKLVRPSHLCILSKNKIGKKHLYELISDSHTTHLAKDPVVLKELLEEKREGLLIGSACSNGEVFDTAYYDSYEELLDVMKFYDYIEIQPLDLYDVIIEKSNPTITRRNIKDTILKIIKASKELGKLVVVTSDIHHLNKEDKIYREIYVNAPLVGGGRHPLADMEEIPSFHFRSIDELMDNFSFLREEEAFEYIVANTQKINDLIESYELFPKDLFAPQDDFLADRGIESIKDATIKMTYDNAMAQYGDPLPPVIKDRIEKELNSIITNKFAPIYYIAYMLVDYSKKAGYVVGSRGSVGSSLVAYFMGITEVNALAPHYYCPHCHFMAMKYSDDEIKKYGLTEEEKELQDVLREYGTGYDLPKRVCPICGEELSQNGVDIPFETFLGFKGNKTPDIDLNFSGDFQAKAHEFCRTVFGVDRAFRAGTIGTVAEKTAYGYAKGYAERKNLILRNCEIDRLAKKLQDVKRVTGQHPGGIVVIPKEIEFTDIIPVQYPADDVNSSWRTTHFDYHQFEDNLLKLDILGHDDPTMIRHLMNFVEEHPEDFPFSTVEDIPLTDTEVFKLFNGLESLGLTEADTFGQSIGTTGIPEFGTSLAKSMLSEIRPKRVDSLLKISGLSHGKMVWMGNARDFMLGIYPGFEKVPFEKLIGCRDDIMVYLMSKNLPAIDAFNIMETVRKHKGLTSDQIKEMKEHDVPDWYIESCKLIEYMFPKAHATAYVIMALRIGWFKVHRPIYYYAGFFSRRAEQFDVEAMAGGFSMIRVRLSELKEKIDKKSASEKEIEIYNTLLLALEMTARGYHFKQIDINRSEAINFKICEDKKTLLIPFKALESLGISTAIGIVEKRNQNQYTSKQDVMRRSGLNSTQFEKLNLLGAFKDLPESDQLGLFQDFDIK